MIFLEPERRILDEYRTGIRDVPGKIGPQDLQYRGTELFRFLSVFCCVPVAVQDRLLERVQPMRLIRFVLALIVLGLGALWSLQGLGFVKGSFMTGQTQWLYIGLVTMLVGVVGLRWASRTRV
jgi:hypothetical protein